MPTAGEEGYENLVRCPYDKAHEIRKGRMQFHLEKCRKNFPESQLVNCPYNSNHQIPKAELQYHMDEECANRSTWDRFTHEVSSVECPVKDLVPVNAATVGDGGENWDDFQTTGSVLQHIKAEAEKKPILRLCQVAPKAERKAFRQQERLRFSSVLEAQQNQQPYEKAMSDTSSHVSNNQPLPRPKRQPNVPVVKQDPTKAVAAINKQFRTLDLNMKSPVGDVAPSETSSMINGPPSEIGASTSRQMPFSYAAASRSAAGHPPNASGAGNGSTPLMTVLTSQRGKNPYAVSQGLTANRPSSVLSNISTGSSSISMMSARTNQPATLDTSRSATALSNSSYATASVGRSANRSPSEMSNSSVGSSMSSMKNIHRPPNSAACRPNTAMSIEASVASFRRAPLTDEEGFCQIPIPGLGRGRRKHVQ